MSDRVVRFILAGDSAGAVKAFEETGVASETTGKKIEATGAKSDAALAATATGAKRLRTAIAGVGLFGMAVGLKDIVQAGIGAQKQSAQLTLALHGNAAAVKAVTKAADEQSTHGGFASPEELGGITQLIRLTGSARKAMKLNAEAVDLARGANEDYGTAVGQVERIQTGQVGRLQKLLGIIIPAKKNTQQLTAAYNAQQQSIRIATKGDTALQQQTLANAKQQYQAAVRQAQTQDKRATAAAANTAIMRKFGGATDAYSRIAAGAMSNASNSFHLLAVSLSKGVLPPLATLARWMAKNPKVVMGFVLALTALIGVITAYEIAVKAAAVATALLDVAASPITAVILAVIALGVGIALLIKHFDSVKSAAKAVWKVLGDAFNWPINQAKRYLALLKRIYSHPAHALLHPRADLKAAGHFAFGGGAVRTFEHPGAAAHSVAHFFGLSSGGLVPGPAATRTATARRPAPVISRPTCGGGPKALNLKIPLLVDGRVLAETEVRIPLTSAT